MAPRSTGRGRSVTLLAALLLSAGLALPASVAAHAELVTMTPADGATVANRPTQIVGTFSEALNPRSSFVVVYGDTVIASGGTVDPADPTRMTIELPALFAGTHAVRWTSVSAEDGDIQRGTTTFTYTPPPVTPSPTSAATEAPSATHSPAATSTADSTAAPSPTGSPSPAPSADTSPASSSTADILLPIIAAVVLIAGFGYWLLRRRSGAGGTP